ncbi:Peptidoglycan/LPS O-acetylase OafA/YrhL, contains acyltransferase and SGNH-hydrolase domains [Mycolicibacterium fluoranthenivorans]|uniref:Peptidoglycan/LPS O-acetylase OafA/YrhL, contains acyltransferase and SGNH-hydrolase domains n=2 Tax=Mycolicibacterium fluoranthenivorans TaxID=258505 RepID=A0A1G4WVJ0_9MYCO|nr:Peptidoglycan/LPS O-acetylase OafA/YrhL, contains acyltransferase and SGNH-hydrolase domains [Mycolicibacterium fluoranthenivorans]
MVAVLAVFANHLWSLPGGGFVGIDVFFVISGFLVTGNLLRDGERAGRVSFRHFYGNRFLRIVPVATLVLILTYVAATLLFPPFRAQQVGADAIWAFLFVSNWRFAMLGTDQFGASSVSPILHYWSLSIGEQFTFVWPIVIFVICLVAIRKRWDHRHRMLSAACAMGVVIVASLAWSIYESAASPMWAYFNTFARVWELGVGALVATAAGILVKIPAGLKPFLTWLGLGAIAVSMIVIGGGSSGFPAPLALLPVCGAVLVIVAGIGGEPRYQGFLCNPASNYIGNISYSLYLVHWPVIVILGAIMDANIYFYLCVLALSFGLAIGSYHFVENPLRRADWQKFRVGVQKVRRRKWPAARPNPYAAVSVLALLIVALCLYTMRPETYHQKLPPLDIPVASDETDVLDQPGSAGPPPGSGPLASALHEEIVAALAATAWPHLDPSLESVINGPQIAPDVTRCGADALPNIEQCTWGEATAQTRILVVGDSVALSYVGTLREMALNSAGRIQVHTEATFGCTFANDIIDRPSLTPACKGRIQHAIDVINSTKPSVVLIANSYMPKRILGSERDMKQTEWAKTLRDAIAKFQGSAGKVVLVSAPPGDANITDCYGARSSTPADCVGRVTNQWSSVAGVERDLAKSVGGTWIDSRPWFCSGGRLCPSFIGPVPTKHDMLHMSIAYGQKLYAVMQESLKQSGVLG